MINLWNDPRTNMLFTAIDYKNKTNVKKVVSNISIKIYQLFSKQRILGFQVTIVQCSIIISNLFIVDNFR